MKSTLMKHFRLFSFDEESYNAHPPKKEEKKGFSLKSKMAAKMAACGTNYLKIEAI